MNTPTAIMNQLNIEARVRSALGWLSDSERLPKLQRALLFILVLWAINSAANVVIALIPSDQMARQEYMLINPAPSTSVASISAEIIDVSSILGADVFGTVAVSEAQATIEEVA